MSSNRVLRKYPFLFFVIAAIVVSNNIYKYAPAQVLNDPWDKVVPGIMIFFGILGYVWKYFENRKKS